MDRTNKRKFPILLSTLCLSVAMMLLSGCLTYKDVDIQGVEDVKIKQLTKKGIEADVAIKIKNPNGYKITISASDLDVSINGKTMGKAKIKDPIVLEKKSDQTYNFTVEAEYIDAAAGGILGLITMATGKSMNLGLKGKIKARAMLVSKQVDIDFTEKIDL